MQRAPTTLLPTKNAAWVTTLRQKIVKLDVRLTAYRRGAFVLF